MTTTPPAPTTSHVQIWLPRIGKSRTPRWSVLITAGATDEELTLLAERAVRTFHLVGDRLKTAGAEDATTGTGDLAAGTGDLA